MTEADRVKSLKALETSVNEYVDREVRRLRMERAFLKTLLKTGADQAAERGRLSDEVLAVNKVRELLGVG